MITDNIQLHNGLYFILTTHSVNSNTFYIPLALQNNLLVDNKTNEYPYSKNGKINSFNKAPTYILIEIVHFIHLSAST